FVLLYSHELRMYTQVMLLVTVYLSLYLRARRKMDRLSWLGFGLVALLAVYTHMLAALPLVGVGCHALYHRAERGALWRTVAVGVLLLVLYVPWLGTIVSEQEQVTGSLRPLWQETALNPVKPLTAVAFLLLGSPPSLRPWLSEVVSGQFVLVYVAFSWFMTLSLLLLSVLIGWKGRKTGRLAGMFLPVAVLAATMSPTLIYLVRPFFLPERTMAAAVPCLFLFLGWAGSQKGTPLPWLVGLLGVGMLGGSVGYLLSEPAKPPYRGVMEYVAAGYEVGDVIVHTSDGSYLPALRYGEWANHYLVAGDPDPRKPVPVYEAVGGALVEAEEIEVAERLWLVVALEHSLEWQKERVGVILAGYEVVEVEEMGGVQVYLLEKE
ncbi:MAG TPA: hypothetical protein VLL52_25860, partial [Anaerolineae bacterium]|nr:hypothetical protein [Anaerolineae bacterium]